MLGDVSFSELVETDYKSSLAWDKSILSVFLPFRWEHTLFPRGNSRIVQGTAVTSDKAVSQWRENSKYLGTLGGRHGLVISMRNLAFSRKSKHTGSWGDYGPFFLWIFLLNHTHTDTPTHTDTEQTIHQPPSPPLQIIRHVKSTKNFFFFAFLKICFQL